MASTGGSSRQARTATVGFKTEAKLVKLPVTTVSTTGVSQAGDSSVSSTQATTAGGGLIKSTAVRREVLIRQPSYCKILDDLKGAEARVGHHGVNLKQESGVDSGSLDVADSDESGDALTGQQQVQTITINGQQYQIVSPIGVDGVQTLVTASGGGGGGSPTPGAAALQNSSVVQYAASTQNGQTVFIPGTVATATASGPQIISVASASGPAPAQTSPVSVSGSDHGCHSGGHTGVGEVTRKRELRLLKNREAARECRNKKKEYIKCLENRVAILENQNKALIEELRSLKELYSGQKS